LITTLSAYNGSPPENANILVRLDTADALPTTTVLTLDGGNGGGSGRFCELDLNGNNQTLAGLTNTMSVTARNQTVTNKGNPATLTVNNSDDYTFGRSSIHVFNSTNYTTRARIQGAISLVKAGVGRFTLVESHTYTGTTIITGGTLALASSAALPAASTVSIGAGTLNVGAGVSSATTGTLDCTGAATISLADNASAIVFGDSSTLTWTGSLQITGNFVSGTSIRFGDGSGDGLSAAQLTQITASGFANFGIDGSGFLTADTVAGSGFATWKTTNNATGQGLDDDHDGDGVTNGVEYFIGGPTGNTSGFTSLPGVVPSGGNPSVTFVKAGDYTGGYGVQVSQSLAPDSWSVAATSLAPNIPGTVHVIGNNVTYTFPTGTKNFARLVVTGP